MRKVTSKKIRVAFYFRVSTVHESQVSALENQIAWCENLIGKYPDWEVVERYIDKGISGTQVKKRPKFLKMIEDAKKGEFNLIVTREVSRFARNTLDTLTYTRELTEHGIEVFFVTDNIRTSDPDGESRLTNMAAYAQDESRKISSRVKAGQSIAREKNVLFGSGNILGYTRVKKTFVIDEEQAETVRMIFKLYLEGNGLKAIKTELTKAGRENSKGKVKWFESTLSRMISNPMYIGKQYQNQTSVIDYLKHKIKKNDKTEFVLIDGDFEPIIDAKDFEKVQAIKSKKVVKNLGGKTCGRKQSKDTWMNLLQCGCGSSYQQYKWRLNKRTNEVVKGYVCRHRITNGSTKYRIEKKLPLQGACDNKTLSDWVLELMAKDLIEQIWDFRKESVINTFELIKENYVPDEYDNIIKIKEHNSNIERYKQKHSKLVELYTDRIIDKKEFIDSRDKYNVNIKESEEELKKIEGGLALVEKNLEKRLQCIKIALEQLINFDSEKLDEGIINQLVDKVVVRGDKEFEWLLNLSDIETTDLFDTVITEKIENKRVNTLEVRDKNYTFAFKSMITLDRAKAYKKTYGKYLRPDKWEDINFSVYVR